MTTQANHDSPHPLMTSHDPFMTSCDPAGPTRVAISSLMAVGRVHHHLVTLQKRSRVGLLLETAEAREVGRPAPSSLLVEERIILIESLEASTGS